MSSLAANRTAKAIVLAAAIRRHLPAVATDPDVARSIGHQAPEFWQLLASTADTLPPSVDTVQTVVAILVGTVHTDADEADGRALLAGM